MKKDNKGIIIILIIIAIGFFMFKGGNTFLGSTYEWEGQVCEVSEPTTLEGYDLNELEAISDGECSQSNGIFCYNQDILNPTILLISEYSKKYDGSVSNFEGLYSDRGYSSSGLDSYPRTGWQDMGHGCQPYQENCVEECSTNQECWDVYQDCYYLCDYGTCGSIQTYESLSYPDCYTTGISGTYGGILFQTYSKYNDYIKVYRTVDKCTQFLDEIKNAQTPYTYPSEFNFYSKDDIIYWCIDEWYLWETNNRELIDEWHSFMLEPQDSIKYKTIKGVQVWKKEGEDLLAIINGDLQIEMFPEEVVTKYIDTFYNCEDICPTIIGWRISNGVCVSDSGCDYDSLTYTYYGTSDNCELALNPPECTTNADCPQDTCYGFECVNGNCVGPQLEPSQPSCPLGEAQYQGYPDCEWKCESDIWNTINPCNWGEKIYPEQGCLVGWGIVVALGALIIFSMGKKK